MITLYTWKTPNGKKPAIMLEELGIPYNVHPIDLSKNEQFSEEFLSISPNNKIPGLVDDDPYMEPLKLFESGAILTYLAEKYGKFLPEEGPERYQAIEWVYWQVGGLGPMLGQLGHFAKMADEKDPQAIQRFTKEADRLLTVLDNKLKETVYLAGDMYTIADMAAYPWADAAVTFLSDTLSESLKNKDSVKRWLKLVGDRPAVQKGMSILQ